MCNLHRNLVARQNSAIITFMTTFTIKTRFCPSPTGLIHLGNCRTALFNQLYANSKQGVFLLRIEDTDISRSTLEHAHHLMADLRWLNIDWQEGADAVPEGPNGPYWQSQRAVVYKTYYEQLIASKRAYPCFCSDEELALRRKLQLSAGKPPRYAGTCRELSSAEVQEKLTTGAKPALRFHMPDDEVIQFDDLVKGLQRYSGADIGDFIIRRADGGASFMFCNAIDDSLMGVTHALRGEDHLTNTPRQIAILKALNLRAPIYGHLSLILGQDGAPLSKRNGSRSVYDLRAEGYLPIAVLNYLARLGHYYESNDLMSSEQLAKNFAPSHLSHSAARFDEQQLLHWQKEAMKQINSIDLWTLMPSAVHELVNEAKREAFINLVKPNIVFPAQALHWATILFAEKLAYDDDAKEVLLNTPESVFRAAITALNTQGHEFVALAEYVKATAQVKGKALFQPLRVALTGDLHGPEMAVIAEFLGAEKMRQRFEQALSSGFIE